IIFICILNIIKKSKISFFKIVYNRFLLTSQVENMLFLQNKMKNNYFVNNFLKLNFGLQYYFFYNILRFLLSLKNENIFRVVSYNKLFKKFATIINALPFVGKIDTNNDITKCYLNEYKNKYDPILQGKLLQYRNKKFSSEMAPEYFRS